MKFKAVDEIDQFSFDDCTIKEFKVEPDRVSLQLDALIVEPNNSQNTNFTRSYAGLTYVRFLGGKLEYAVKDGFRLRDPNGKIIEQRPDKLLSADEAAPIPETCAGASLYAIENQAKKEGRKVVSLNIDFPQENEYDTLVTDSYRFYISYDKAIFEWENYLSKVQE